MNSNDYAPVGGGGHLEIEVSKNDMDEFDLSDEE